MVDQALPWLGPTRLEGSIHFIGIGGIGMSGIAEILLAGGYPVSGSDLKMTPLLSELEKKGARILLGHRPENLSGCDAVVYSTAIRPDNPELLAAQTAGLPLLHRAEALAELLRFRWGICVSGTHGKTTTTSMVTAVLLGAGLDVSAVVGARLALIGSNARSGSSPWIVTEADESDRSFLRLPGVCHVVTNIDNDHMDEYRDMDDLTEAFVKFMNRVPFYGLVVACSEDQATVRALKKVHRPVLTYAISREAQLVARNVRSEAYGSRYECVYQGHLLGPVELTVSGRHNVLNSLAAVAVGLWVGLPFLKISASLREFRGADRRLQFKGEKAGVRVFDDYGHHPTEIRATLEACQGWGERLVVVFQPHRFSRTAHLMDELSRCFDAADVVYLLDIYSAGEDPLPGVDSEALAAMIKKRRAVIYAPGPADVLGHLARESRKGDVLLTMGAGDVWKIGEQFLEQE